MTNQLTFNGKTLTPIIKDNQVWFNAYQIGTALGYSDPRVGVRKVFNRNKDEFATNMTEVISSVTSGNLKQPERIFSLRGCHLVAMLARTETAKEFRKWVLDVIDNETNPEPVNPSIESIITELSVEPNMTRYLITVDGHGAKMQPMDVTGKSLVDAQAARYLIRDMNQMYNLMGEMVLRMGVLSGDCSVK